MSLPNSPHFAEVIYKVSAVVVSPDPLDVPDIEDEAWMEGITLDQFDQFCTGGRVGSCLWQFDIGVLYFKVSVYFM